MHHASVYQGYSQLRTMLAITIYLILSLFPVPAAQTVDKVLVSVG